VTPGIPKTIVIPIDNKLTGNQALVKKLTAFTNIKVKIPQNELIIAFLIGFSDLIAICTNIKDEKTEKIKKYAAVLDISTSL
jgi:hypothetical protein